MLQQPAVFVDLETTGTNPVHDRVTEIAVIEVRGGEVVDEWSTLLNPGTSIPPPIQGLTGITNAMVANQPGFSEIGEALFEALEGRLLVAHNARFDYGFLRNEFLRAGLRFQAPLLCTVRLSRLLYPNERRHNLDSIIRRHALDAGSRHRAMGDARVIHAFMEDLYQRHPVQRVDNAIEQLRKRQTLPMGLPASVLDNLPDTPGVYLFYDERDVLLYVGKSVRVRERVLSHFSSDYRSRTDARLSQQVRRIDFIETAGELGALIREASLIKQRQPLHNRRLRRHKEMCAIVWDPEPSDVPPRIVYTGRVEPAALSGVCGLFRNRRQAQGVLRQLATEHELCLKRLGLEKGGGACFAYQLKKCRGVCVGEESELRHKLRMTEAMAGLRLRPWPFPGPIGIREHCALNGLTELHVVDHWCYRGSVASEEALGAWLEQSPPASFDLDTYKILARFLRRPGNAIVVNLAGRGEVGLPEVPEVHRARVPLGYG